MSNRAAALELKYKGIQGSAPSSNRGAEQQITAGFHGTLPWKGSPAAQLVFDTLVGFNYRLPTAMAAVAPRFGGELPALARILIEHKHLHGWTGEMMAREMEAVTPLEVLESESAVMLLWLVITEVAGCPFLAAALKGPVTELLESGKSLRLDPGLTPLELANRGPDLVAFAVDVVESLRASLHLFPVPCAQVLYGVQQAVGKRYGVMGHAVAGSLLWHRYLLEGLLAPGALGIAHAGSVAPGGGGGLEYAAADRPGTAAATAPFAASLRLAHRVLGRACDAGAAFGGAAPAAGGGDEEAGLELLGPYLPVLRARMDALLHDVLSLGSPATAVAPRGGVFDVAMLPDDAGTVRTFLREHYVQVHSAMMDLFGEPLATEISMRLRPALFPDGRAPALPRYAHEPPAPLSLTGTAYLDDADSRPPPAPRGAGAGEPAPGGATATATDPDADAGRCGVGIILRKDAYGLFTVITLTKGGPAESSGVVLVGDTLVEVNGRPVLGMSLAQVKQTILGPVGTPLKLVLNHHHNGSVERREVCLFRGSLRSSAVNAGAVVMPKAAAAAPPTWAVNESEAARLYDEMSRVWAEVQELQQRRMRAEKALHAAEGLRVEYQAAVDKVLQENIRLEKEIQHHGKELNRLKQQRMKIQDQVDSKKSVGAGPGLFAPTWGGDASGSPAAWPIGPAATPASQPTANGNGSAAHRPAAAEEEKQKSCTQQ